MLTREQRDALIAALPADPDRSGLLVTLERRAAPLLTSAPPIPRVKALLSRDGGICPTDGQPLHFDPWSPDRHRCPGCGEAFAGERHHRHWARAQHLWLAERMAELSLLAAVTGDQAAADRALELYAGYDDLYFDLPNRDNVLGPSHLFFSTYLESLWITSYLAGAFILRESGHLSGERADGISRVADEAAGLIGEFNEGLSNRQTWHAAALTAISAWFGDEELARIAVESRTGLLGHLTDGFGGDGFWWEGENYHLFALRGLMLGLHWSHLAGYELLDDPGLLAHFREAVLAPARSALPDLSYPARRDSRFGVSLAEPSSLELWEVGRAWLGGDAELDAWLAALYARPPRESRPLLYDAWLHEAGRPRDAAPARTGLSWWALTAMGTPLPANRTPWQPQSTLLSDQGLAILRRGTRYASLECGRDIGGHGHPDRLHLTLHADGVHWLPDPGTGSYVEPELAWYRSALAHNAPRLDGTNAGGADAWCSAFDAGADWGWCRAVAGSATRTLIAGADHLVDIVEIDATGRARVDLPWHFTGAIAVETAGKWEPVHWDEPFVSDPERFIPAAAGPIVIGVAGQSGGPVVRAWLLAPGAELLRARAPGLPGSREARPFLLMRSPGQALRWVTVLDLSGTVPDRKVTGLEAEGNVVEVRSAAGATRYQAGPQGLSIVCDGARTELSGLRAAPRTPAVKPPPPPEAHAIALRITEPPALDGSLDGFETGEPLILGSELQYKRSEEPYDAERFSATAWVNWDGESLYLAVEVRKPEVLFPEADAPPLALDNEAEDVNADGLQIHLRFGEEAVGVLAGPRDGGALHTRRLDGPGEGSLTVSGSWSLTGEGYLVTLRLADRRLSLLHPGSRIGFDLLVNEMQPERLRRAGQLAWSGGGGWIYLRGDRHDSGELGVLELG